MPKNIFFHQLFTYTLTLLAGFLFVVFCLACPALAQADSTVVAAYPQQTHTFVLTADGALWAWGDNSYGGLGDGTTINRNVPIHIAIEDVAELYPQSAGHTFALKKDGTLWAWGSNSAGCSGAGTENLICLTPVQILDDVAKVFPLKQHSFALKKDGTLWAWGSNSAGQLGDGSTENRFSPVKINLDPIETVEPGENNTFAILKDGTLWAWGNNRYGKLGDGTTINRNRPVKISDNIKAVYPRETHTIALDKNGTVWAWGYNWYGQLGDGTTDTQTKPVKTALEHADQLFVEKYHAFAFDTSGTLWAWGNNWYGQLGDHSISNRNKPVKVSISGIDQLYPKEYHTFVLKKDGSLWAWGRNWDGRLGDSSNTHVRSAPVKIADQVTEAFILERHAFAVDNKGVASGWGNNTRGKLGTGANTDLNSPEEIPLETINTLYPLEGHTFALKKDGSLWAWGDNNKGQLGVGSFRQQEVPVRVLLGDDLPRYNITLTANPPDAGRLTGSGSYRHGESVSISAEPGSGFTFINWTEDDEVLSNETNLSFLASRDLNLTANFKANEEKQPPKKEEEKKYTIKLTADPEKGGKVVGAGTFEAGREIVIAAEPAKGFEFLNWTENNKEISKSTILSFKVTADRSLTAHFKPLQEEEPEEVTYAVALFSRPEEGGTAKGAGNYPENSKVTVKAEPAEGYSFAKWTEAIERTEIVDEQEIITETEVEVSKNLSYTFVLDRDRTLIANFTEETVETELLLLDISAVNGIITALFSGDFESAPVLEEFTAWFNKETALENDTDEETETTDGTPDNTADEAGENEEESEENSEPDILWNKLPLTALDWQQEEAGKVTLSFTPFSAEEEAFLYTIKLQYQEGEALKAAPFSVAAAEKCRLSLIAEPPEGGVVTGAGTCHRGQEVTIFAEANTFYRFSGWYAGEELISDLARFSFTIEDDLLLTARFEMLPATIEEATATNGAVEVIMDRAPDEAPIAGDFELLVKGQPCLPADEEEPSAGPEENEGEEPQPGQESWEPLIISAIHWLENEKKAILNFEPFAAQSEDFCYTIKVNYGGFCEAVAEPFTVEAFNQYVLSLSLSPEEAGTVTGGGRFKEGSTVTAEASAKEGYAFLGWYEEENLISAEASYSFTLQADLNLSARFEKIAEDENDEDDEGAGAGDEDENAGTPVDLFISLSANPIDAGTVTGGGTYLEGDQAVIEANSAPGYDFYAWEEEGQAVSFNNPYEFTVTRDTVLTALFKPFDDLFDIALTVTPENSGTASGGGTYGKNETVVLSATPFAGHSFKGWFDEEELISSEAEFSFVAEKNLLLEARFKEEEEESSTLEETEDGPAALQQKMSAFVTEEELPGEPLNEPGQAAFYAISLFAQPEEGGATVGAGLYEEDDLIGLNAIPAEGFEFIGWYEEDEKISIAKAYAFKVAADRTLTARFAPLENRQHETAQTFLVSLAPLPLDGGTVYGGGEYTEGEEITIDCVANLDYFFVNWTEDGEEVSTDIIYTFVVERDIKLEANFAPLLLSSAGGKSDPRLSFEKFLNTYFADFVKPTASHNKQTALARPGQRAGLGLPPMGGGNH